MPDDWNAIATLQGEGYREARKILGQYGRVRRTDFYNVLVITAKDPATVLERLDQLAIEQPGIMNLISRVVPAEAAFDFDSPEDFEDKARAAVLAWAPALQGKSFHIRMHRRGFKDALKSPAEERFLDDALLGATREAGDPARISFEDPDAIIAVETVGNRAGLSFWTREDLRRHPLLKLD